MPEYMHQRRRDEAESFFCRFTFGQFFALLMLEVFTLFFVFYLGARYGGDLLGFGSESARQEVAGADVLEGPERVPTTADPEVRQMADELISKAKTPELKDRIKHMIENAQDPGGQNDVPEVVAVQREAVEEPAEQIPGVESEPLYEEVRPGADVPQRSGQQVEMRQATPEADASVIRVKSAENAKYSVQVGSYPQLDEASRVVERWKTKGYPAYLMIADIPDRGRWYRVRLGGFETRGDATHYLNEFQSREDVEALVVLNEE